ncbi:hypothetical protein Pcinc_022627 [Petrolisthes cinctipes]|uniref:Uncharacterized protein n=1 Tax=Petrolisthes cinctipes TaxID=88211 RepID=A0AAE1FDD2_PETCI|nr:hypothetical protein Pcinc_022627 [Petrolisthes cinctipes]
MIILIAEEEEKIHQGLSTSRPKRRHKPNKNYNCAEIVPLIKAEPEDEYDGEEHPPEHPPNPTPTRTQRLKQEEKENTAPTSNSVTNAIATIASSVTNSLAPPTKSEDGARRRNLELLEDSEDDWMVVSFNTAAVRDESVFPRAEEFLPECWLRHNKPLGPIHPYSALAPEYALGDALLSRRCTVAHT